MAGRIARSLYRRVESLLKRYKLVVAEGKNIHSFVKGYPRFSIGWNRSLIFFAVALASRWTRPALESFWQITASTTLSRPSRKISLPFLPESRCHTQFPRSCCR